jgi:hypothetical protein
MSTLPESRRFALALEGSVKNARSYRSTPPLSKNEIDAWEKEILAKFQDFMEKNPRVRWVHWSMTDDKFGWPLIRRRSLEHKITDHTQSS